MEFVERHRYQQEIGVAEESAVCIPSAQLLHLHGRKRGDAEKLSSNPSIRTNLVPTTQLAPDATNATGVF